MNKVRIIVVKGRGDGLSLGQCLLDDPCTCEFILRQLQQFAGVVLECGLAADLEEDGLGESCGCARGSEGERRGGRVATNLDAETPALGLGHHGRCGTGGATEPHHVRLWVEA